MDAHASFEDFTKLDIRTGRIVGVSELRKARRPSYKLLIDFGDSIGTKRSAAQVVNYAPDELHGMIVIAVVNLPPLRIAGLSSEVLVLGAKGDDGNVALLSPTKPTSPGEAIF